MELKINRMALKNFKGAKNSELVFDGKSVKLLGENSTFKTTTSDAYFWLFADTNTALVKNPPITPLGAEECESRVEIEMTVDGKVCTIAKSQKFKTKTDDSGKTTSSVSNTYEINSVEKSYKAFVADLEDRGIDIENFLIFSNQNAFTSDYSKQGREKMRSVLFKMCEGVTDSDVAADINNIEELKILLETYKLDEIEQMNKATVKKIVEEMGKDNSIVNARIDELISQKSTLDAKVLEEQIVNYESEIARIDEALENISSGKADIQEKLSELKTKKNDISYKANEKLNESKADLDKQIHELSRTLDENNYQLEKIDSNIQRTKTAIAEKKADIEKQRTLYKTEQDAVIDESELSCPVCHREYEAEKLNEIKAEFEKNKTQRLKVIKESGDALKAGIKEKESELKTLKEKSKTLSGVIGKTQKLKDEKLSELEKLPTTVNLEDNKEWIKINAELEELEKQLSESDSENEKKLKSQKNVNRQMLNQVIAELGTLEKNKDIDKRVEELRQLRKDSEVKRANAEKILNQVETFKKAKNNKLSERINSHFKVAQFRLFRTLKNGSVEDACDVIVDGKEINSQANQSLQVLAKLDIIRGLSDYFETWLPVFADDYALITSGTDNRVVMKNQLIKLIATEGVKELEVKGV